MESKGLDIGWANDRLSEGIGIELVIGLDIGWANDRLSVGIGIESVIKVFDDGC